MWTTAGSPEPPPRATGLLRTTEILTTCLTRAIPSAVGASLLVRTGRDRAVGVGATGPVVAWADALQSETGQGPGLEVLATGSPRRSPDVRHDERWPRWARRLRTAELRGVTVAPVWVPAGRCAGALHVYTNADEDDLVQQVDAFAELLGAAASLTGGPLEQSLGRG